MSDLASAPNYQFFFADLIGKPFELGGRGPNSYDCYGLMMELGRRIGLQFPDYRSPDTLSKASGYIEAQRPLWTPCAPGPGAVVAIRVMGAVAHVGMVLPFDRMIHVWERSGGVCIERLASWERRICGYYIYTPQ